MYFRTESIKIKSTDLLGFVVYKEMEQLQYIMETGKGKDDTEREDQEKLEDCRETFYGTASLLHRLRKFRTNGRK